MLIRNSYMFAYQQLHVNGASVMTMNGTGIEAGGEGTVKTAEDRGAEQKKVTIEVNGHKVEMLEGPASGLEIKEAAIKQGVGIKPNFVLQQEMPNGIGKVIGDDDKVIIREHLSFTAIEPDDNS